MPERREAAARDVAGSLPYLLVPLLFTYVVYRPVVGAYFKGDDWMNLQQIANGPALRYVLQPFGGHVVIVRNLIWYLSYQAFGMNVPAWFWMVLLTHLLNVALLFAVVRLLCGNRLACLAATLWGTAPMHEGTLAWYAVYGQVVAATLVLVLLLDMVRCGRAGQRISAWRALGWSALLLVASMCFGIPIGVAFGFPVIVWLAFGTHAVSRRAWAVLLALPVAVGIGYFAAHRIVAAVYGGPSERFMEGMVAQLAWRSVAGMTLYLFAAGMSGLLVGLVSPLGPGVEVALTGLASPLALNPNPLMIAVTAVGAVGALAALIAGSPETRRWLLVMLAIAGCGYTIIAAGRATMYAASPDLYGHGGAQLRYHYLVPIALAAAVALVLNELGTRVAVRGKTALLVLTICGLAVAWERGSWQIDQHTRSREMALQTVNGISSAMAAAGAGAPVYILNQWFPPCGVPQTYFAGTAAVYLIYFPRDERQVYFVEKKTAVRDSIAPDTRLARLIVRPDVVPAGTQPAEVTPQLHRRLGGQPPRG